MRVRGPEGEVAPYRPGSVGKVHRELERLGQPRSRTEQALKRSFDLVGGAVLLPIVLAPVWLIISLLIKADSPGPILFRQWRVGRNGEHFRIIKFRTMVDGADELKDQLRGLNEADGLFKISDDPRLTRVGRRLRRCSCDELPQIFNVLLGQMSLVGPPTPNPPRGLSDHGRAPKPALDAARDDRRLAGERRIDDPYQGNGGPRPRLHQAVVLWLDMKLLLRTASHVVHRRGW